MVLLPSWGVLCWGPWFRRMRTIQRQTHISRPRSACQKQCSPVAGPQGTSSFLEPDLQDKREYANPPEDQLLPPGPPSSSFKAHSPGPPLLGHLAQSCQRAPLFIHKASLRSSAWKSDSHYFLRWASGESQTQPLHSRDAWTSSSIDSSGEQTPGYMFM